MLGWRNTLCLVMSVCLLFGLTGCGSIIEESVRLSELPPIKAGTTSPLADEQVEETFTSTLCFLSETGEQLIRVPRVLTLTGGASRAEAIVNALLAGPQPDERGRWPEVRGTTRARLERSGPVVTVSLPPRFRSLEPEQLYAVRYAIAESVLALPEVNYVNVLVGDREEGVDLAGSIPAGTFSHHAGTRISGIYAEFEGIRTNGGRFSSLVTLYFPSQDGRYLLPVIRNVEFDSASSIEYMNTLLEELGKGSGMHEVPDPLVYLEEMPEIIRDRNGKDRVMMLHFSGETDEALEELDLNRELWLAMISETLLTFVPNVDGLEVRIGDQLITSVSETEAVDSRAVKIENGLIERTHFEHLLGTVVTGYMADESEKMLTPFEMCISASQEGNPHAILSALLNAEEVRSIMPDKTSGTDVLAIRSEREQLVVNLSREFGKGLDSLSSRQRRLCLYAMVNTLTEGQKDQVIFFFGGAQKMPTDELELRGCFMRAPGMIR